MIIFGPTCIALLIHLITDLYRREPPPPLELEEELLPDEGANPTIILGEMEDADRVRHALTLITPEQRQVITLRFLEGLERS